jgi:ComF family protein
MERVYEHLSQVVGRFFPPTCMLCLDPGQLPSLDLCPACQADLPRALPACTGCALPLPRADAFLCGDCLRRTRAFDAAFAAYRYQFPVDSLIRRLKYGGDLAVARVLGTLLGQAAATAHALHVEALLPVPLHRKREAERGYNQAGEIARFAGRRLGLPVLHGYVRRRRATAEQVGLGALERADNLRGAFELLRPLPVARVALVDDVMTTGSTAEELAAVLREGGADWIESWCVARAALTPRRGA